MATYTSNYGWTKPSGSDNVDISVLNDNLDDQDSTIHDAFLNMAPPFSESSTYAVDDIVLYDTKLYKCHTAVTTPGSWTGSTNWQVYKLSEGGGGGLTLGETSSTAYRGDRGKVAYDHSQTVGNPHGTTKSDVGLGNVPNVSTNEQEPTFTEASTRNNIASGDKLSVIFGKIQKFFNDLKTVAFTGSYTDLTDKPIIPTTAGGITYDNTDSGLTATDVQGAVDEVVDTLDGLYNGLIKIATKTGSFTPTVATPNYFLIEDKIFDDVPGYTIIGVFVASGAPSTVLFSGVSDYNITNGTNHKALYASYVSRVASITNYKVTVVRIKSAVIAS